MKHNYPKNRRLCQDTMTAELLRTVPLDEIFRIWFEHGLYKSAKTLNTSPGVLHYICKRNNWKRPLPPHLIKAYNDGNWKNLKTNFIETLNQTNDNAN